MQSSKMFEGAKPSNPHKTIKTSVSGIRDEAIFPGVESFASLWVKKGRMYFLVRIYGLPVSDTQSKEKTLAQHVVSKL